MSFGYINENTAAMRGPMVMQLLQQFVSMTSWGELDYLVLDMPPGTGDVQLTLTQILNITAAIVVTTPQRLSFVDVVKGIDLFDRVNVPSVAVVENMASYSTGPALRLDDGEEGNWNKLEVDFRGVLSLADEELDGAIAELAAAHAHAFSLPSPSEVDEASQIEEASDVTSKRARLLAMVSRERAAACGPKEHLLFGKGHRQRLSEMWGIQNTIRLPLYESAAKFGDGGTPLVVGEPDHPLSMQFTELAKSIVREVEKVKVLNAHPALRFDEASFKLVVDEGIEGKEELVDPLGLRLACKCAACVEELTGKPLLDPSTVPEGVKPVDFGPVGNYALSVDWSDGHRSLYPYAAFIKSRQAGQAKRMPAATAGNDFGR
mmetsp:Transcript_17945/g.41063  ORF Transcript_17945/g.41063 Transcript_17945/m.41063 type:complete len:376 (+) Transcript_17945:49-1176(+)